MIRWIAKLRADRKQLRELLILLEGLTDPTFLDRAIAKSPYQNAVDRATKAMARFKDKEVLDMLGGNNANR